MNELTLDQFGVTEKRGVPVVGSRRVAEIFDKEHKNVLRSISDKIKSSKEDDFMAQFCAVNFIESTYKERGKRFPEYLLTRDGFSFVAMGFTGKEADRFKVAYINRFNEMEQFIKSLMAAKLEFPDFTDAIMAAHEEPKHYHFSNEINMINTIVLGMNAKKFKEANGIGSVPSIRPYLTPQQISMIEKLQRVDIGLIISESDYQKRKEILTAHYNRLASIKLIQAV